MNKKTITLTVIIGLVTSLIYESMFRPTFGWFFHFLLNVSTLGLEKYKDNIYIEISKGFHEDMSLQIYKLSIGLLIGFVLSLILMLLVRKSKDENSYIHKIFKTPSRVMDSKIFLVTYIVVLLAITSLDITQNVYINKTITYYNQLLNIISPNLDFNQFQIFNSRFAQISKRQDYIDIINELTDLAKINNKTIPKKITFIF